MKLMSLMINQHILPALRVHRHRMGCSAISREVGWGSPVAKSSVLWGLIWRQCKSSYLRVYWVDPCSWRFAIEVAELLVALYRMCCKNWTYLLRASNVLSMSYMAFALSWCCDMQKRWYPDMGFWHHILPSQRKSSSFTDFWTMHHWACPGGGGGSSELGNRSSVGRVWQLYWPQGRPGLKKPVVVSTVRVISLPEW